MKHLILSAVMALASSSAFAVQTIDLQAGSVITVNASETTQISCSGQSGATTSTQCKFEKDVYGNFYVSTRNGTTVLKTAKLDEALTMMQKLAGAGLCN